jgi:succinoglycan biosynthesis transport protein ExoP
LNQLALEFVDQNLKARLKMSQDTGESLSRLLDGAQARLRQSEAALQAYAVEAGLVFTADNTNVATEKLHQLQDDLSKAEADRIGKQSRFGIAKSSVVSTLPEVLNSSSLREYESRLTELRRQRAELAITYTVEQTQIKRLDAQIALVERALHAEQENILGRIQNEYREAERRQGLFQTKYRAQAQIVCDLGQRAIQYNILQHQVEAIGRSMMQCCSG